MDKLKQACRIHTSFAVNRYLMANAHGRWDGAEKATRHRELCQFYAAVHLGVEPDDVELGGPEYMAIHEATQALTDYLDEAIGFPLDGRPDYDLLAPLFFEQFHALAMAASVGPNERMLQYRLRQIMSHVNEAEKANNLPGGRAEAIQELCDAIAKDYNLGLGWTCGGIETPNVQGHKPHSPGD